MASVLSLDVSRRRPVRDGKYWYFDIFGEPTANFIGSDEESVPSFQEEGRPRGPKGWARGLKSFGEGNIASFGQGGKSTIIWSLVQTVRKARGGINYRFCRACI